MKAKDIHIGGVYLVKVSGHVVPVRVLEKTESYHHRCAGCGAWRDNWLCLSLKTGRQFVVKSPVRFRSEASQPC